MLARAILVLAVIGGCHRDQAPPAAPPSSVIGGDLLDPGAGSADVIVARVDGRPVWGSCVEGHVKARGVSVDQALKDCIDLELLAAAAVKRGLLADGDTQSDLRAAIVDGFVGKEFEDKVTTAADLPKALVESNLYKNRFELDRPELRLLVYARVPLPPKTPDGAPEERAARALADEIYAVVGPRTDLFAEDLGVIAKKIAGARKIEVTKSPYLTPRYGRAHESVAAATFAIPDIGQVSPPTRTPWGWDVILLTDIVPAQQRTRDEQIVEMFPGLRRFYFDQEWAAQYAKDHAIEEYPEQLAEPDEVPAGSGSGSAAAP